MADAALAYKAAKEAFVSNLNGTSLTEVNIVVAALPISDLRRWNS